MNRIGPKYALLRAYIAQRMTLGDLIAHTVHALVIATVVVTTLL